jgi:hypothetical protein
VKATSPVRRAAAIVTSVAAMTLTTVLAPAAAHAADSEHYYIEIGGTGLTLPPPQCTTSYDDVNRHLDPASIRPVCYPASAGPFIGSDGSLGDALTALTKANVDSSVKTATHAVTAPNYDSSVNQGYQNALSVAEETYHQHPNARLTITGYSQGAQIADEVLQTIANGTDIPSSQVDGMLYADPMQPDTGIWAKAPKGWSALGFTSPGPGPAEFKGIPVERFCIYGDPICDARSPLNIPGYFTLHPTYPNPGGIITQTLPNDGGDGPQWK